MTETNSKLTWLEEWLFFFQFGYGRTHVRWCDYHNTWDVRIKAAREIIRKKLQITKQTRGWWPMYVYLDEDEDLRCEQWNDLLGRQKYRMIMHDNTNAGRLAKSSNQELNQATWSSYYGANVAKGGVAVQS